MGTALIVDDSPADRALFRRLLSGHGHEVRELSRGAEALERARVDRPHVIILDVNLPDTDGHSVCRSLKADAELRDIPVLMLTVRDDERDVLAGLHAGADDYVAKDADGEIILARVNRLILDRQMTLAAALNVGLIQVGRLLAGIVHEIRGPLSVIRGNAELMRLSLGNEHNGMQWIEPIIRNCKVLQVRLEHLMSTVRGGPPRLEPLELGPLAREAAELFQKGIDSRTGRLALAFDLPADLPHVVGDAGRILQVILNLLTNAHEAILAAAREHGGTICLRAVADDRGGVRLEVLDDGPGIPPVHLARLFEPFYTTKAGGTGYGLYLAAEILREHGGSLAARNLDGGGACFALWLPMAPTPRPLPS